MQFENSSSQNECASYCSECKWAPPFHDADCPRHRKTVALLALYGHDYSHLVGGPLNQHQRLDAVQFDGLLTDYDRILLRFGMHISW